MRAPTFRSPRTAYPTVSPTRSPNNAAIRAAAARAANRRGSATTMRPDDPAASANGTNVVLPVPGGATSTATPRSANVAVIRSSSGRTGRSGSSGSFITDQSAAPPARRFHRPTAADHVIAVRSGTTAPFRTDAARYFPMVDRQLRCGR